MRDISELEKVSNYLGRLARSLDGIGFYPRSLDRYAFDTIACSMLSKLTALSRSCLILIKAGQADEAYGLSRSIVEGALILRYITSDAKLQDGRAAEFVAFSFEYKNVWLSHARDQFAGAPIGDDVERVARHWKLSGDTKKAKKHWSKLRGFTWGAQNLVHPLDGSTFDPGYKRKQYDVDYFQSCQWVHVSQPALDNYVPDEGAPFKLRKSSDEFGRPGHSVLYLIVNYVNSAACYALYGMAVSRPTEIGAAFRETLESMKPVDSGDVFIA